MSMVNRGPDATDQREDKLTNAVDHVEKHKGDRWPMRGHANVKGTGEYRPYDGVSRNGRIVPYRKYPSSS